MNTFKDVDSYIAHSPKEVQPILKKLRRVIKKVAPKARERISYSMPFYEYGGTGYKGRFLYFGVFKKHISLFIMPRHTDTVPAQMKKYHVSKATYRFPYNQPFPFALVEKTIRKMRAERDAK
jgi:uncharacterized protein YdhG (YjbR/CyaY superfamily)